MGRSIPCFAMSSLTIGKISDKCHSRKGANPPALVAMPSAGVYILHTQAYEATTYPKSSRMVFDECKKFGILRISGVTSLYRQQAILHRVS